MNAPLPPCPTCKAPLEPVPNELGPLFRCSAYCEKPEDVVASPAAWRRLSAPPLPPNVVAVLRALAVPDGRVRVRPLAVAREAWIAANCPGLVKS